MSDRGVFVAAFLTVVLIVASAFALPQFFFFDLYKSSIFIIIAVMVYFGEDKYSYMLGILAPPLWTLLDILLGGFIPDLKVLIDYLARKPLGAVDTPLHGLALISMWVLTILSIRAWRKQVSEPFFGKTFAVALGVSLAYVLIGGAWYYVTFSKTMHLP